MTNQKYTLIRIQGFTIVELIIVISVIGILATITIVGYGSWRTSATTAQLKSDLNGVAAAMENARNFGNGYPLTVPTSFTPSSGVSLTGGSKTVDNTIYCVDASRSDSSDVYYIVSGNPTPRTGSCSAYSNMAAIWHLNGNFNDQSGSGKNGTVVGATLTAGQTGSGNGAYSFDGVGNYISLGTGTDYDYSSFSISLWAKATASAQSHVKNLIGKGNWNDANDWYLGFKTADTLSFVYGIGWTSGPSYPLASFDVTRWHHYVGVATPTTQALYLDGNLVSTVTVTHGTVVNAYDLQLARSSYYGNFFNGKLDDVRIYNKALSANEAQALFVSGAQ